MRINFQLHYLEGEISLVSKVCGNELGSKDWPHERLTSSNLRFRAAAGGLLFISKIINFREWEFYKKLYHNEKLVTIFHIFFDIELLRHRYLRTKYIPTYLIKFWY